MLEEQSKTIRRVEYTAPAFWIDTVDLTFDLDPAKTRVLNKMRMRRNPDVAAQALRLDGEELGTRHGQWRRNLLQNGRQSTGS
jgi:aminopeptidase N